MTARDIRYGRAGGRVVAWVPLPDNTVRVRCRCCTWIVVPRDVGQKCWTCKTPFKLVPGRAA